ncbi:MAG: glycine dehydrogenase (decarboxylating) alpha subunit/glycine dehydrogenase (decarboxylating) beta [Actinomycetia bacterium]|nr:glycine dehydrogenase (decarboxylating) alpha subunit/glycine dehydrogenase (decarboxylating) beta [Actinomycetes bacterium]
MADAGDGGAFVARHVGPDPAEQRAMLDELGLGALGELVGQAVPAAIRNREPLDLPEARSETETLAALRELASGNQVFTSLIGCGYSDTITPAVIRRNVLENPAWYTAYTPYQPEISQGRLEALLNFQTMISDLTGMDLANASLLDEATAAAEGMTMLHRVNPKAGDTFVVDADAHPQTIDVVRTRAEPLGLRVVVADPWTDLPADDVFGVLLQYPGSGGEVRDLTPVIEAAHAQGTLVVVAADLLALTLLVSPGELGADLVVGTSQRFGVPLGYGGPHAGYLATRDAHKRTMPGRLVGVSVDDAGRPALRLALQTREQHIRREKATSNICTAQVLLAIMAGLYAAYHGPEGLEAIARRVNRLTRALADGLRDAEFDVVTSAFFDTITVRAPGRAAEIAAAARELRINLRELDGDTLGIALDETTTPAIVDAVWTAFGIVGGDAPGENETGTSWPEGLSRTSEYLTHPVFHRYRSETEMLRYLRRLADKDVALDRSMIPLGSCTMKLNATTEMESITWPEFGGLHPFAPVEQAAGYAELFDDLERWLAELTGYDAVSLQPNAGSQGELAGLLAIRAFHRASGADRRDVCLIPSSAHGTNAASAVMAGMKVVVVACDDRGNVDFDDLKQKATEHADDLSCLMVTYPSTHGVFEGHIREVCALVHEYGGQVYVDGANLNALVGLAKPGKFGADVSHLNLHKTFCIPHGGGGPGVGPIGVRAHLAPYLPNHPLVATAGPSTGVGAISAAPWGSAGILPIPWAYITMMGGEGLTYATQVAILNANYVAARLAPAFPVLYTGEHGRVAHECILDLRPLTQATGVTVDDVAKRLIDYGFHAPTVSFPVAGSLMIEPTESEGKVELDRFCDAMLAIRAEIAAVERGEIAIDDSALRHAPHTAEDVVADDWNRGYSRESAAYPVPALRAAKYWPPVSRIDGAYGDRNVMCACPPIEAYAD